ncbi:MAG: hypothetical protein M0024_07635 [Nitrospiraceae bacterium]|nr:hypothetical protein [Nitrospiraceae bacterium]
MAAFTRMTLPAALLGVLFLMLFSARPLSAKGPDRILLYFFRAEGCPHCGEEEVFLSALKERHPRLDIQSFEVKGSRDNAALFSRISELYGVKVRGVPATFVGGLPPVIGFQGDGISGREIEEQVRYCETHRCTDPMAKPDTAVTPDMGLGMDHGAQEQGLCREDEDCPGTGEDSLPAPTLTIPFIGRLDTAGTALSYQTVLIAALDSFNPCAFFVLFTLLGLLIHVQSRGRILLVGGIFVFFSGFIYFIFMAAWLNIFLLTGQIAAVTIIAGVVALLIAAINIKDFFFFRKGVSLSIPEAAKPKLFDRMRRLLKANSFPAIIAGTVVLAAAANAYELFCTAGFPMVYTRILTLHALSRASYYLYLAFYNIIYIIPLGLVVVLFAVTLGARKLTEWQGQLLKLFSGMMMLCLGLLLLIRPALLNNLLATAGILAASLSLSAVIACISRRANHKTV